VRVYQFRHIRVMEERRYRTRVGRGGLRSMVGDRVLADERFQVLPAASATSRTPVPL
jgi:hypothetical protein